MDYSIALYASKLHKISGLGKINGYFGCFGVRAYPFKEAQKVSINFELSPYVEQNGQSGFFRAWLGVGYHFGGGGRK